MTTPAYASPAPADLPAQRRAARASTIVDTFRSEWIKFRTVRSSYITLGVTVLLAVGIGALISWGAASSFSTASPTDKATWDPTSTSLSGAAIAQLAVAVLGVMGVTGEYSSGMVRTSLAAVPRRWRWLTAKAVVYTAVVLVIGEIICFAAFLIGQPIIGIWAPNASFGDAHVLRAVIGGGLYAAVITLVAVGVGALLRNTAGGIAIMVALIFVLPAVFVALPSSIQNPVEKWWPTNAGGQIADVVRGSHTLTPWAGFGVFLAFAAIVLFVAFWLLQHRDA